MFMMVLVTVDLFGEMFLCGLLQSRLKVLGLLNQRWNTWRRTRRVRARYLGPITSKQTAPQRISTIRRDGGLTSSFSNNVTSLYFHGLNGCEPTIYMRPRTHGAGRLQTPLPSNNTTPRARDGG
jgi:hypothetical protein